MIAWKLSSQAISKAITFSTQFSFPAMMTVHVLPYANDYDFFL